MLLDVPKVVLEEAVLIIPVGSHVKVNLDRKRNARQCRMKCQK